MKRYNYTSSSPLQTPKEVVTYNYGTDTDAGWNRILKVITTELYTGSTVTSIVTETIDYDAIGNPISYRGATMGWYGRQMTSYAKNGVSITNTYDVEGVRGSKTVNGSKTIYQYINGQLYYEKRGDGIGKKRTAIDVANSSRSVANTRIFNGKPVKINRRISSGPRIYYP